MASEIEEAHMPSIVKGPYLQWPARDAITIMWETFSAASSAVSYWETEKQHSGLSGSLRRLGVGGRIFCCWWAMW